jgi:DNA repair exonuclease SbcCD ATPase subunit
MSDFQKELSLIFQKISELKNLQVELENLENKALRMEKEYVSLRKLGLEKIISTSQYVEKVKISLKARTERQKLKDEYQTIEVKLSGLKKQLTFSESELIELRSQRDQFMISAATSEAEVARIDESITEEKKRKKSLAITQEKINIIKAYRKILDPKTGIANYLLKKSQSYLEETVNSVLEECGALFRAYINDEFELNISSSNQPEQRSENFLSATLGSGYQKFVLSLAFRAALWRLAEVPLLDCQFIDEGFGCCDEENLEAIIQYLIASISAHNAPRIIFIVSHIETLKNAIQ